MIFKLHYWFMASGANALGLLLGVFFATYTDASSTQIGFLYMLMPFSAMIFKPIICSYADRKRAHQKWLIGSLLITAISYLPFVVVPMLGPQIYAEHPRFCWYLFLAFKVVGDIAFGGASSIGDSLAINYAHRVGTDFAVYRVWATISWMVFGLIVGQINEIWFLPKYVPAFMVLISASLINAFIIWLWPAEYFIMVPMNETLKRNKAAEIKKVAAPVSKVLMPRAVVWAHARRRLIALFTCSWSKLKDDTDKKPSTLAATAGQKSSTEETMVGVIQTAEVERKISNNDKPVEIDRSTQIKILMLLLRRDPRISLYAIMLIVGGASVVPLSFFIMQLSEVCHSTGKCDYSQLVGLLQVTMALAESFLFIYIKRVVAIIGRLNIAAFAFALVFLKYTFYATIWPSVNPYFALLSEVPHGLVFAIFLTLMVELGHLFSNEVEFIIPELVEQGIGNESICEELKMSLAATMQAIMSSANDGIGRGLGALLYGVILDRYGYQTLWSFVATGAGIAFALTVATNLLDHCLDLKLGLDQQYNRDQLAREAIELQQAQAKEHGLTNLSEGFDTISIKSRGKNPSDIKMQQIT